MSFNYDTVNVGDAVEVATEFPPQNWVSGKVVKADAMSCHIGIDGSQFPPLEFCRHIEDDYLKDGGEKFRKQQKLLNGDGLIGQNEYGPRTGVFRLSENQKRLSELPQLVSSLQRQLTTLTAKLASIEERLTEEAPRRGPGRPPGSKNRPKALEPVAG